MFSQITLIFARKFGCLFSNVPSLGLAPFESLYRCFGIMQLLRYACVLTSIHIQNRISPIDKIGRVPVSTPKNKKA